MKLLFVFFQAEKQQKLRLNNMVGDMRDEYDLSKGERGKFFHKNAKMNLPVYLDDDMMSFVEGIAQKRKMDVSTVVNILLRSDKQLSDAIN